MSRLSELLRCIPLISVFLIFPAFSDENSDCTLAEFSRIKDELIEEKRRLIEKEKQLIKKNRELTENEKQISQERQLRIEQRELRAALDVEKKNEEQELVSSLDVEEEWEEPLLAQEEQQEAQPEASQTYTNQEQVEKCGSPFRLMHVGVRHTEARGVGYKKGYTTLEGFGIWDRCSAMMPFLDVRGHLFDNGKWAGNVGAGVRSYFRPIDHVVGAYLYYDIRQGRHRLTAQQLSPGIELLGDWMEYRINGYFPVGNQKTRKYGFEFAEFDGNEIILESKQQRVMTGGDAEVGVHLTQSTKYDIYAGAGPYYFTATHESAWGGKVRLLGRYKQYVSLEASYSYDHLFKNVVQGTVALNIPFGHKIRRKGKKCTQQTNLALGRAAFAPYRFEIPVIKKVSRKEKAINPATDQPWTVWFVNNTSSSSGTFESPFPTLALAESASSENDIIYVFPGDGTTTGMDMGITLQNSQYLWGSGNSHPLQTTQGNIKIPSFTNSVPSITNTAGDVVDLASGNEVSGFNILVATAGSSGIFGSMVKIGATITDNLITGSVDHNGIFVFQENGEFLVKNNQLAATGSNFQRGIRIRSDNNSFTDVTISNNNVRGYSTGMDFGAESANFLTNGNLTVTENTVSNYALIGIIMRYGYVGGNINFSRNTIINYDGFESILLRMLNSNPVNFGKFTIEGNDIITYSPIARPAIRVSLEGAPSSFLKADLHGNNVIVGNAAGSIGILVQVTAGNTICASITDNQTPLQSPGTTTGLEISALGSGVIDIDSLYGNGDVSPVITGNVNFVPPGTCD